MDGRSLVASEGAKAQGHREAAPTHSFVDRSLVHHSGWGWLGFDTQRSSAPPHIHGPPPCSHRQGSWGVLPHPRNVRRAMVPSNSVNGGGGEGMGLLGYPAVPA